MQILISDQSFGDDARLEREVAEAVGVEVTVASCRDEDDVADALEPHRPDVLLVQFAPVGRRALASAHGLGGIVRYGVGVDNIDLMAATERGIAVARIPDYCLDEVADHTLALMLAVERGIVALARDVEAGWSFRAAGTLRRLSGRTFGLLGFGQVARRVAWRAAAFGYCVLAHDPALSADEIHADGAEPRSLEALLGDADVLWIHAPLTDSTRGLLDARALELLHEGAIETALALARGEWPGGARERVNARLAGKRCPVTGGSGIGRAVALRFAAEGAAVVVTGRRAEKLEETAARAGNITIQAGDAGNADDARAMVEAVVSRHGGLDVLFHGAGVLRRNETDMAYVGRDFAAMRDQVAAGLPLRRVGTPEDMIGPAVFLASDEASWMTGHSLIVDGGWTAQ